MDIVTRESKSNELSTEPEAKYLLNLKNGRVFIWTPILAVDMNFVDCDFRGVAVEEPAGNDPFIRQEMKLQVDTMYAAGASDGTVAGYGQELAIRAKSKYKALGTDEKDYVRLESKNEIDIDDPYFWVFDKIEKSAQAALQHIKYDTLKALYNIADKKFNVKPTNEVSFDWQIDMVKAEIHAGA